ncbi:MAG TPA: TIGR00725 family protein [Clostridiales bacterium]|nr:TIGR00725 family protein [Clostridiales bacterium]
MTSRRPIQIAVVGAAECDRSIATLAEETGRLIAEAGAVLITGGRGGVMEAASRGARSCGGIAVGILPGPDDGQANPYLSVLLPTDLGIARNALVVRAASAVIAIAGGFGTLSEIAMALKEGIPVVALRTWQARSPAGQELPVYPAASAGEAVALALRLSQPAG